VEYRPWLWKRKSGTELPRSRKRYVQKSKDGLSTGHEDELQEVPVLVRGIHPFVSKRGSTPKTKDKFKRKTTTPILTRHCSGKEKAGFIV
jgi:hypothetical protein